MSEQEQYDLPESARHAVEAHAEVAGDGAHLPLHSQGDDGHGRQVAERFDVPVGSETPASDQA